MANLAMAIPEMMSGAPEDAAGAEDSIVTEKTFVEFSNQYLSLNKKIIDNKTIYVAESLTEKKIVPNFLINKDEVVNDLSILLDGLKLVGDFMDKNILKPNNLNFPISRNQFINSLKQLS